MADGLLLDQDYGGGIAFHDLADLLFFNGRYFRRLVEADILARIAEQEIDDALRAVLSLAFLRVACSDL